MGELHLEVIVDRLLREFNVNANVGAPRVAYRETITKQLSLISNTLSSLVVAVSMVTLSLPSSPTKKAKYEFKDELRVA